MGRRCYLQLYRGRVCEGVRGVGMWGSRLRRTLRNPMLRLRFHPHPNLLPSREKGPEGTGMWGYRLHGNDGGAPPHLRPVCAPLSRTLDSSLRWNDGGGLTLILTFSPQGRRGFPAYVGMTETPLCPVCTPLSRTLDSSLRWNDGGRGVTRGRRRFLGGLRR